MKWTHLVHNELLKIYKRKMFWIMLSILTVIIILMAVMTLNTVGPHGDWKKDLRADKANLQMQLKDPSASKGYEKELNSQIKADDYQIEHNIPPVFEDTVFGFIETTKELISVLIGVFVVIIGGSIVSQEYSWGTIKLLLIRPIQRWKILLSKFIAMALTGIFFILAGFIISFIVAALFFGFDMGAGRYLYVTGQTIHDVAMGTHLLEVYGSNFVDVLMMGAFAFMLSTIFKTNALAIGLSIFLSFAGPIVVGILSAFNENIGKYLFFLNTNLYQYVEGHSMLGDTTMAFSATVLAVYFIIFLLISFLIFSKRDVAE